MSILPHPHRRHSNLYLYDRIQPVTDQSNTEGSIIVVTERPPNDVWLEYVDRQRRTRNMTLTSGAFDYPPTLGPANATYALDGVWPEQVTVLPGCFNI